MVSLEKFTIDFDMLNPMPDHIEALLDRSYNSLLTYIDNKSKSGAGLCDLKNVNFMQGFIPDYTDAGQCSLYLLRYGAAYTVEYRAAYDEIFGGQYIIPGDVCVLSIGCGTCLDKAAAFFAMKKHSKFKDKELIYYGVDIARWDVDVFDDVETKFIHNGIQNVGSDDIETLVDIVFFPKSISEISEQWLDIFLENIAKDDFQNKICIVASNRNSTADCYKSKVFTEKFCKKFKFECIKEIEIQKNYKTHEPSRNIWSVFEHFSFPQYAINAGSNPKNLCSLVDVCDKTQCEDELNRNVTLKTTLFNTIIYCLERR